MQAGFEPQPQLQLDHWRVIKSFGYKLGRTYFLYFPVHSNYNVLLNRRRLGPNLIVSSREHVQHKSSISLHWCNFMNTFLLYTSICLLLLYIFLMSRFYCFILFYLMLALSVISGPVVLFCFLTFCFFLTTVERFHLSEVF